MNRPRTSSSSSSPPSSASSAATASPGRSEEHTSELQSSQISYAVFCLKKKKTTDPAADRYVTEAQSKHQHLRDVALGGPSGALPRIDRAGLERGERQLCVIPTARAHITT